MGDTLCLKKCSYRSTWVWCNGSVSKFAFTTFVCSVEIFFLKPNNMEWKTTLGNDIMIPQPYKN